MKIRKYLLTNTSANTIPQNLLIRLAYSTHMTYSSCTVLTNVNNIARNATFKMEIHHSECQDCLIKQEKSFPLAWADPAFYCYQVQHTLVCADKLHFIQVIDLPKPGTSNDCFIYLSISPLLKHEGIMEGSLWSEAF